MKPSLITDWGTEGLAALQTAALEATANSIVITDVAGTVIWVNSAFERLTGYTHEEMVGKSTRVLKSGQTPQALYQQMWRTILEGRVWRGELINRRKDGTPYDEEMTVTPVQDRQGTITHFIASKLDITERKRIGRRLLHLSAVVESSDEAIIGEASDGTILTWNAGAQRMYEYSAEEAVGKHISIILSPGEQDESPGQLQKTNRDGIVRHLRTVHEKKDGDRIHIDRTVLPVNDATGRAVGFSTIAHDITERVKDEERSRLWFRVLDQCAEGIIICDPQERILLVNRAFEQLTGFSADEVLGKTPRILRSGRQSKAFYADLWKVVSETGSWRGEMWNRRKNGEVYAEWLSISATYDHDGAITHYVGIFSDITARKEVEERMYHLVHFDALTGLPNRVLLMDRLDQLTKAARRTKSKVAVVFIDLNRFKEVNNSLGHNAGDLLLQVLARRLSGMVRAEDTVARLGGDEFVVAFQGVLEIQDAALLAQKLLACLIEPIKVNGSELTVTASMGISLYPDDAANGQEMIRNADAAMRQAKGTGFNTFQFYTSDLNQRALELLSIESALRRAIEHREFVLHYQPVVDIATGYVVGAEALVRWNHPELGLMMPGKFIPMAEERGLIIPIGNWVMDEVARQAAAWKDSPELSFPLGINVSAAQFRQPDFVEQFANIVRKHGLSPAGFELELTEGLVMSDAETMINMLERLHDLGFRLSIDDFGTGYSSLSYLRRFPIDRIKIDQSFVADIAKNESTSSIVKAIIALAHGLKLKLVAEGVETQEQLRMLREYGCDEAQGFLFSRAVASGEFENLARTWQPKYAGS